LFQEEAAAANAPKVQPSPDIKNLQEQFEPFCKVSRLAIQGDPRTNKDYRNNPSLLIQFQDDNNKTRNIVIDVGKTFRETALRWMPPHQVQSLDAVILTHHHMDAVAGLDDLRGFQSFSRPVPEAPPVRTPMHIYLSQECFDQVSRQFPWLFPKSAPPPVTKDEHGNTIVVKRDVAALDVTIIDDYQPFDAMGLKVIPLPVWHGEDLICMGYAFTLRSSGGKTTNVVYLSDISRMKDETLEYIQTKLPPTDIFVVDTLLEDRVHPVHFSLKQASDLAIQIGAKKTYLVGMSCDAFVPHDEMNAKLEARSDLDIRLAHDGLVLDL
jgi:phosphoribosyl 1,2-cyclic phosphodiesterase